jgi:hypothetical protein
MELLPVLAIIISVIGLLYQHFALIGGIKERLVRVETRVELFWNAIEGRVIEMLKSPTHLEKDELLDQLLHKEIRLPGAQRLRTILLEELNNRKRIDNGKKLAYALMIGRLEQVIYEFGGKHKKC